MSNVDEAIARGTGGRMIDDLDDDELSDFFNTFGFDGAGFPPESIREIIGDGYVDQTFHAPGQYLRKISMDTPIEQLTPTEARAKLVAMDLIRDKIGQGAMAVA